MDRTIRLGGAVTNDSLKPESNSSVPPTQDVSVSPLSNASRTACPYGQAFSLRQALSPDKMRVGFFLGAGCPVSIRVDAGATKAPLIPNIEGLTKIVREKMAASDQHKVHFAKILDVLGDTSTNVRTVEDILSRIRSLADAVGTKPFEGMTKDQLIGLDKAVCDTITEVVTKRLPSRNTPYHHLAAWIGSIPRAHAVELFTSNYDLLMEQALEECNVPYFDGFSGSDRAFFDTASMEQDKLPSEWARLWKVHGSINWWRTPEKEVQRKAQPGTGDLQMIHPSHLKYDQSRVMPYLAMQDRLRAFLSRGQVVLVTCGYSFADDHLNRAILEGLRGNPSAVCFGLLYEDRSRAALSIAKVGNRGNLRLLGADGGLLGTVDMNWHAKTKADNEFHGWAISDGDLGSRTKAPAERCKFLVGDFNVLGLLLAGELTQRGFDAENRDAH